jgi:hypothetical protein
MRDLNELDAFRIKTPDILRRFGSYGDDSAGVFMIPYPLVGDRLKCLAASGNGWDHLSVSLERSQRTPTWAEMEYAKRTFFKDNEVAIQLHVAVDDHISIHPYVLHLWRPLDYEITLPPKVFV